MSFYETKKNYENTNDYKSCNEDALRESISQRELENCTPGKDNLHSLVLG